MDRHLKQTFNFRYLKIGEIVNSGVLQIGCGAGETQRTPHVAYTTVGTSLVGVSAPPQFSVPLQAAIREKL
ncbi:hypothetical protein [Neobacillus cucumis]|uniref:Uncharacterized protein n=1 Tax=Neobacillus cucumis TaxID=1740721 RepID=A0A2N5HA91_9BACI|nr:hypothetical protein [Neobacillus cucumis]PLS02400.1 hypothetical protein CVD27_19795 [Neobacillus cucumis]